MLERSKVFVFALFFLSHIVCDVSYLSASSSSSTGRIAQRKAYRQGQSPSKPVQPNERLDLTEVQANKGVILSSNKSQTTNNTTGKQSEEENENKKNSLQENNNIVAYQSNLQLPTSYYLALNEPNRNYRYGGGYNSNSSQTPRYGGEWANRYASPNDAADYQPNYNPVPQMDWDDQQNWQYYRREYFSGETQPEVYRQHHPYGTGGIGYDPDPDYLRLQQMEQGYYK